MAGFASPRAVQRALRHDDDCFIKLDVAEETKVVLMAPGFGVVCGKEKDEGVKGGASVFRKIGKGYDMLSAKDAIAKRDWEKLGRIAAESSHPDVQKFVVGEAAKLSGKGVACFTLSHKERDSVKAATLVSEVARNGDREIAGFAIGIAAEKRLWGVLSSLSVNYGGWRGELAKNEFVHATIGDLEETVAFGRAHPKGEWVSDVVRQFGAYGSDVVSRAVADMCLKEGDHGGLGFVIGRNRSWENAKYAMDAAAEAKAWGALASARSESGGGLWDRICRYAEGPFRNAGVEDVAEAVGARDWVSVSYFFQFGKQEVKDCAFEALARAGRLELKHGPVETYLLGFYKTAKGIK